MSKRSLYYFDSSDDEDKETNDKYTSKKILDTAATIKQQYLTPSYILTEVSQSILEQENIQKKYIALKNTVSEVLKIPKNVDLYNKANKFLGKYLIKKEYTSKIDLDKEALDFITKMKLACDQAKKHLNKEDFFYKYKDKIFQKDQDIISEKTILKIDSEQTRLENRCLKVCSDLLGMSQASSKSSDNINKLVQAIFRDFDKNLFLSEIFNDLKEKKCTNFTQPEEKLKLLKDITVKDFIQKAIIGFNLDLIEKSYRNIMSANTFKLKDEEDEQNYEFLSKKEQRMAQQKTLLDQYNEFVTQYFSKDYIELCYRIDEEDNKYVDKNKFSLFVSHILDDEESITKNTNAVLAQYFSEQNQSITKELMAYRDMYPVFDSGEDYFAGFKLNHRIVKAKLKTNGILDKQEIIHSAKIIKNTTISVIEKLTINSSGTREDYKFLPNDQGSYESVAMELSKFNGISIRNSLKSILQGKAKELESYGPSQKLYLYRLADLLFNCEGERNISALLTNAMFFELVEQGIYNVKDLPDRMPMAMKGAIQASRYTLDVLGGKYEEENAKNYLTKRQYFDYKTTTYKKESFIQIKNVFSTQKELKEVLLHYELALKDQRIFCDWINKKHNPDVDNCILLLNTINRIYDVNTKEFKNEDVSYIEQKNKVCISQLKSLFKKERLALEDPFREELIKTMHVLKEKLVDTIQPSEFNVLKEGIVKYILQIQNLEQKITHEMCISSNILSIDEYMEKVDGYYALLNGLRTNFSEKLFTTKKIKKIRININQEEINTFEQLIEYCSEQVDKLFNITQILLELVQNDIRVQMSKLPEFKINKEIFKSLQSLISEWYGIKLPYLDVELEGCKVDYKAKSIDWINPYFGKYTLDGLGNILDLRLKELKLEDVKTVKGVFINTKEHNIIELLSEIINTTIQTILTPLNLFNKHAAGLIFEKTENNSIQVKYLDPENKPVPIQLEQIFNEYHLNIKQLNLEQQKYANCGPVLIEDFIFYLTRQCLSQEEAIPFHSQLIEQNLLHENYGDIHIQLSGGDMGIAYN